MSESEPMNLGAGSSYLALCNALLSGLGALSAGFGIFVSVWFIVHGADRAMWILLAVMAVAFTMSVVNGVWSVKAAKHPTRHGMAKILVTTFSALIVFACLKAATA